MTFKPLTGLFSCAEVTPKTGKQLPDYGSGTATQDFHQLIFNDLKNGTGIETKGKTGKSDAEKINRPHCDPGHGRNA
jgi:hypothetical protein